MNLNIDLTNEDYKNVNQLAYAFCADITDIFGCDIAEIHLFLPKLIEIIQPKKYGEIGSHAGRSAFFVAKSSEQYQTQIHCFDYPNAGWGGQVGTQSSLEKSLNLTAKGRHSIYYGDSHSEFIKQKIKENSPYDIFLIDGDHSSQGMIEDFEIVYDCVNQNGIIIIDDLYHHPELNIAFDQLIQQFNIKKYIKHLDYSFIIHKDKILHRGIGIIQKTE